VIKRLNRLARLTYHRLYMSVLLKLPDFIKLTKRLYRAERFVLESIKTRKSNILSCVTFSSANYVYSDRGSVY